MDFAQGFEVWRGLGMRADGSLLDFSALTAIHYVHRLFAYALLLWLGLLAWRMHRAAAALPSLASARTVDAQARWLAALALLQLASGLSNVVLDWPLLAAVLHTGGAAALVLVLTWALSASRSAALVSRSLSAITAPVGAGRVSV